MGLKTVKAKFDEKTKELDKTIGPFLKEAREINALIILQKQKLEDMQKDPQND